ncbi:MAG TPA: peptide chain release factor 2 [Spirochaetia bacterium]|nr:MAG: peptide chain release factor 2 [Spirochaetes bacterium GWB1_36_13]HCL55741.1 peptide chain release factor 2 [Spirochaetia bacterium]
MIDIDEIVRSLDEIHTKFKETWKSLKLDENQKQTAFLEEKTASPGFWDNPEEANKITREISALKKKQEEWQSLKQKIENLYEIIEITKEEDDSSLLEEVEKEFLYIQNDFSKKELYLFFRGKFDKNNAYLSINAGAGGTESCDWASMLSRMYLRWAEKNEFQVEIVDELPGEEAGIKNITVLIKGDYAFGNLRGENGVHRLVRISPFDSNARRHTSFASVSVIPEIDDDIEVDINPSDLKIDTYRAGGAGGQHVNKTESAVRITHIPTNIIVACQQDRSQHKNKEKALSLLKAKLYLHIEKQKALEHKKMEGEKKDISWGNQIRSYVFQPYQLVKDHRTNYEMGAVDKVMDGEINEFSFEFLKWDLKKHSLS